MALRYESSELLLISLVIMIFIIIIPSCSREQVAAGTADGSSVNRGLASAVFDQPASAFLPEEMLAEIEDIGIDVSF